MRRYIGATNTDNIKIMLAALIIIVLFCMFFFGVTKHFSRGSYIVRVTDKERVVGNNTSKYLVFTELKDTNEIRVFENSDSLLEWKWNSSDIQGKLKTGGTYKIFVYGWRFGFLSWYENILTAEELEKN